VAVENGTHTVISVNFTMFAERKINTYRLHFPPEVPQKELFNSHAWLQQLQLQERRDLLSDDAAIWPVPEQVARAASWVTISRLLYFPATAAPK
jgi:hypothetical protein